MAGSGAGSTWACSTGCGGMWHTCGGGRPGADGRRGWASSTPGRSSASRCAGRAAEPALGPAEPDPWDAAKKMAGRKRVALVDADGIWPGIAVVPASVQERDTLPALDQAKAAWPSLREAVVDGGFTAGRCQEWASPHGMRHHVVVRDPDRKGFVVPARRWVVERSFGWLTRWGGVLRDRAGRLDVAAARLAFVAILAGVQALINPRPIRTNEG